MLAPLVRRTLAPRGQTPVLKQKASHRDRVSVVAGLSISSKRRQPGLLFQTYPKGYINSEKAAEFVREVLRHRRGPVVVLWDNGRMHHGEPIRELQRRFPRLSIEYLPPYAPDLNAVEQLWTLLKYGRLSNYAAPDVRTLDAVATGHLTAIGNSRRSLQSLHAASKLPLYEVTPAT
jgi:putative transposase